MVVVYDSDMSKKSEETQREYVQRICATRSINRLSWDKVADLVNKTLGCSYSSSYYRKNFHKGKFADTAENTVTISASTEHIEDCDGDCKNCDNLVDCLMVWKSELQDQESKLNAKLNSIREEKIKLSDERSQNNAYVRRLTREKTLKEIAHDYAAQMSSKKLLSPTVVTQDFSYSNKSGILLLSDWHYGIECSNYYNEFNPTICRKRVRKLLDQVIQHVQAHKLEEVHVLNLSDLISGRIHTTIRIQNRIDVITQTMDVAEILAEFLTELAGYSKVHYYDCLDNHSRLEPNKGDSLDLESLTRLIPWYLKSRLASLVNASITIHDNEFGEDIITCTVQGHDVIGVHGDHDKPATALDKLTLMTHRHYDLLCTAHLHHFAADEKNQSLIISNGSLMGVDNYSEKLRLTSDPSQTLLIATKSNVCECIYRIVLN